MKIAGLILVILVILGAIFILPAAAQSTWTHQFLGANDDPSTWMTILSFAGGTHGYTCLATLGTEIEGCTPDVVSGVGVVFQMDFPACTITSVSVDVEYNRTRNYLTDPNYLKLNGVTIASHTVTANGAGSFTLSWTGSAAATNLYLYGSVRNNNGADGSYFRITSIAMGGNGSDPFVNGSCEAVVPGLLTRPLAQDDELSDLPMYQIDWINSLEPYTWQIRNMIFAWSNRTDAYVMAAAPGTVTEITDFSGAGCSALAIFFPNNCFVSIPRPGPIPYLIYKSETMATASIVVIKTDDGDEIEYLVRNPYLYIDYGSTVEAGCVLGETMAMEPVLSGAILDFIEGVLSIPLRGIASELIPGGGDPVGLAIVGKRVNGLGGRGYDGSLLGDLTQYALPENACNLDPRFSGCMVNNPQLKNSGDGWQTWGSVTWLSEANGALLLPGGQIYQQLNLAVSTEYTVIVTAYSMALVPGTSSNLTVRLGTNTQNFSFSLGDNDNPEIKFTTTPDPDISGSFYTLAISNTGNTNFVVSGVCVGDGSQQLVSGCTAQNPGFDIDTSNWTNTEGNIQWSNGQVWVPAGDTLSQNITLTPDSEGNPQTWIAEIEAVVWGPPGADGMPGINITWPGETTPVSLPLDPNWNLPGNLGFPDIPEILTTSLEVSTSTSGDFILEATITGDFTGVKIERVCIHPSNQTVDPPLFGVTCSTISQPQDDTIGAWISYHWNNLNRFFTCDLMVFLNRLYREIISFFKMIAWAIRWGMTTITSFFQWITESMFPWLNGHFANMAAGRVTYVDQGGNNANLWDVILALIQQVVAPIVDLLTRLLGGAAELLFNIINAIISIVFGFFTQLFQFLSLIQSLLSGVVLSWNNATPADVPGVPNCMVNPQQSLICVGMWTMDNTIFSGPGALIIPLIISIASIHFFIWAVRDIKKVFLSIGNV